MMNDRALLVPASTILSQTRFFADLTTAQLERVAAICEIREFDEGTQIYRVGELAVHVYVLMRGVVRMAIDYGGRNASAGDVLRRGDVFGWAAMTPSCNLRIATASCIAPSTLLVLDGKEVLKLMEADHTIGYRLMTQLSSLITSTLTAFAGG